ncbi:lysophospholipid acyltransferase family protein [Curvibacter sp. APW13]|uniref:lysophospholipid acyltransferase family protein n=1 Tax=Curvibacter sp. APW13 TaxID=3077236 RepID=UPI0028DF36C4|nr:lysophospholipid acyltransferase family protein [Curvibacter sp. APW13]MDT8989694.1 lysophospholipid acyltransferase family protein [Curvibacter sp. APW13]
MTRRAELPQRSPLTAAWRLLRIAAHVLHGAWVIRNVLPTLDADRRYQHIQAWARQFLVLLAIKLEAPVLPQQHGPLLLVANHISFIDIVVLLATSPCRLVSKADVHHWPLIGPMAAAMGTVFIERESRRDAMRVVHHMAEAFGEGAVLAVFPEGTTGDGRALLPFHGNLLQAAIVTDTLVQPLALRYQDSDSGEPSLAPAYVGDDSLLDTLWRTLRTPGLQVRLVSLPAQRAQGRERRQWAQDLRASIAATLDEGGRA